MNGKYRAEFVNIQKTNPFGSKKTTQGWLNLLNIRDERNLLVAKKGTIDLSKRIRNLGDLKEGDILEFYAKVKEISFEYPQNVRKTDKKIDPENRNILRTFFDTKDK